MNIELKYPLYELAPQTQGFGDNKSVYKRFGQMGHNGLDLGVPEWTPVLAMADGVVRFSGDGAVEMLMGPAAGNCVLITSDGFLTGYAHLNRVYAKEGQKVKAGDVIGLSGNTGASSGPHLHVEVLCVPLALGNGFLGRIDPTPYLEQGGVPEKSGVAIDTTILPVNEGTLMPTPNTVKAMQERKKS